MPRSVHSASPTQPMNDPRLSTPAPTGQSRARSRASRACAHPGVAFARVRQPAMNCMTTGSALSAANGAPSAARQARSSRRTLGVRLGHPINPCNRIAGRYYRTHSDGVRQSIDGTVPPPSGLGCSFADLSPADLLQRLNCGEPLSLRERLPRGAGAAAFQITSRPSPCTRTGTL